jgi:quercetin 2,3-dioxygenase
MITLRRAKERQHERHRKQETWLTFSPRDLANPPADGFGTLEILTEDRLLPGAGVPRHSHDHAEIVTYVREGALAYEDSMGRSGVIHAGEFQRMTPGRGIHHSETNASRTDNAHVFHIGLRPWEADLDSGHEQKRFSAAQRRGVLCVVASPDARKGSLHIHQDALMYSAMLDPGQHLVHELSQGRRAWLHLVQGEVSIGDLVLTAGDGVGISAERAVSLTAREEAEILLVDLGVERPGSS